MAEFTPQETARWNAWQQANAVSARRTDRLRRIVGIAAIGLASIIVVAAVWLR